MIIGNGGNNTNNSFQNRINKNPMNANKEPINPMNNSSNKFERKNVFTNNIFSIKGTDTSNSNAMYDKSIAMLSDRLEKGLITMDEFSKKCNEIANKRNNIK